MEQRRLHALTTPSLLREREIRGYSGRRQAPSVTLDIGDDTTVIYKNVSAQPLFDLAELDPYSEENEPLSEDIERAKKVIRLLSDRIQDLPVTTRVVFISERIEFNHFNGTGYAFGDMIITVKGLGPEIQAPVTGYIEHIYDGRYPSFLFSFPSCCDKSGAAIENYLAILHEEGPGYGENVSTVHAVVLA